MTETTEPLVKLGRGMADDLAVGHWSMGDAIQMIRGLCDRLEALSALPCKGGEAEQLVADFLKAADRLAADSWDGVDDLTRDLFEHAMNKAKWLATPTTEPDTGRGLREALEALRELEEANDTLCATRSQETYIRMVDIDKADDALERLDAARQRARQALAALSDTPRGREISEVETHRADAVAPASKGGAE